MEPRIVGEKTVSPDAMEGLNKRPPKKITPRTKRIDVLPELPVITKKRILFGQCLELYVMQSSKKDRFVVGCTNFRSSSYHKIILAVTKEINEGRITTSAAARDMVQQLVLLITA